MLAPWSSESPPEWQLGDVLVADSATCVVGARVVAYPARLGSGVAAYESSLGCLCNHDHGYDNAGFMCRARPPGHAHNWLSVAGGRRHSTAARMPFGHVGSESTAILLAERIPKPAIVRTARGRNSYRELPIARHARTLPTVWPPILPIVHVWSVSPGGPSSEYRTR